MNVIYCFAKLNYYLILRKQDLGITNCKVVNDER